MTPYERLELHPPDDDRIPHHPPAGVWLPPETRIGRWALLLVLAIVAAVVLLVGSSIAAPRSGLDYSTEPESPAVPAGHRGIDPARSGASHVPSPLLPAAASMQPAATVGSASGDASSVEVRRLATDAVSTPAPTAEGGAVYSASATWCKPTPRYCGGWAPPARLAAVNGFRFGDAPWWARVWRGDLFADVLIVSHCACRGTDAAIDLSPAAFVLLAPLSRGRIAVAVEVLTWPGDSDDPPPHPDDERLRLEDRDAVQ